MQKAGIYSITNQLNGNKYIGSSVNIAKRFREHIGHLRRRTHPNYHLQKAWDKYGENSFHFHVLDYVEDEQELLPCEQQWIDSIKPVYNISPIAGNTRGVIFTEARKTRISEKAKGNRRRLGAVLTDKTKETISNSVKLWWVQHGKRTHCSRGHEYTEENTKLERNKRGTSFRKCRTCVKENQRRLWAAKTKLSLSGLENK